MQNFKNHYELYKALIEGKTIGNDYGVRIDYIKLLKKQLMEG